MKDDETQEMAKAQPYVIVDAAVYASHSIISKTILRKTTGNITVCSFNAGEKTADRTLPFDISVQIVDGTAEVIIDHVLFTLKNGDGIIIPAHSSHRFTANEQFKMLSTVIKSGYES